MHTGQASNELRFELTAQDQLWAGESASGIILTPLIMA